MRHAIAGEIESQGITNLSIIGPAPAFRHRIRGRFRWQLVLRGVDLADFLSQIDIPQGWIIDIDPVGL
jgi:primosomal protein N' (replication factor Y)